MKLTEQEKEVLKAMQKYFDTPEGKQKMRECLEVAFEAARKRLRELGKADQMSWKDWHTPINRLGLE